MKTILDDKTVHKYFRCPERGPTFCGSCAENKPCEHIAFRVIKAMTETISTDERGLYLELYVPGNENGEIREMVAKSNITGFHTYWLRLPDEFQKIEDKKGCDCLMPCPVHWNVVIPVIDHLDVEIESILDAFEVDIFTDTYFKERLQKLVEMARNEVIERLDKKK